MDLWRERDLVSGERSREKKEPESGGNFEKIAVEAAVKKENRDTEREGASLPAARVQARKWDAERERGRDFNILQMRHERDAKVEISMDLNPY